MSDVTLLCVMGLPGAGKTSLCRKMVEHLSDGMDVFHTAFDDEVEETVYNNLEQSCWKEERTRVIETIRMRVSQLRIDASHASKSKCLMLLDDNFYYRSMRQPFFQMAKKYGCGLGFLFVDTSIESCIQQDGQRTIPIGENVIRKMNGRFERPNPAECHWERFCLTLSDSTSIDWVALTTFLIECRTHPWSREAEMAAAAAAELGRGICRTNLVHQADIALRKIFKDFIVQGGSQPDRIAVLKGARSAVLLGLRNGAITLPVDLNVASPEGAQELQQVLRAEFEARLEA